MRRTAALALLAGSLSLGLPMNASSQETGSKLLAVGEMAPDFVLPGATRYGLLKDPIHLSHFRGETVVLAFFYRVRSPG